MRKRVLLPLLIVCTVMILVAACTNVPSTNITSTPALQTDYGAVTVASTPTSVETSPPGGVTAVPTLSAACSDLIAASGDDLVFLNFVNNNNIVTRINGLAYGDCSKLPAQQLNQLVKTSATPQTSGLAQARMYLISATTYCEAPDLAAQNNTGTDLGKSEDKINQYQALVYSCQGQISVNASSAPGGEKLVLNSVQGPQTLSGNGNSVKKFSVTKGGYKFAATYAGSGNFTVHITNIYGKTVAGLFNETGPYSGSTTVNLPSGEYYMSIEASAPYLIKLISSN